MENIFLWLNSGPDARKWKDKYPECILKELGY